MTGPSGIGLKGNSGDKGNKGNKGIDGSTLSTQYDISFNKSVQILENLFVDGFQKIGGDLFITGRLFINGIEFTAGVPAIPEPEPDTGFTDLDTIVQGDAGTHTISFYPITGNAAETGDIVGFFILRNSVLELRGKGIVSYVDTTGQYFMPPVEIERFQGETQLTTVSYFKITETEETIINIPTENFPVLVDGGDDTIAVEVNLLQTEPEPEPE